MAHDCARRSMCGKKVRLVALLLTGAGWVAACSSPGTATPISSTGQPPPTPGTGSTTPTPTDASTDSSVDAADAADGAPPCLGDRPAQTAETPCPPGACEASCQRVRPRYKGQVADAVAACLANERACNADTNVVLCVDRAFARACPTAEAKTLCAQLVPACDPNAGGVGSIIDLEGCESLFRGLSPAGRDELGTCIRAKITAGTCAREVGACADAIRR